MRESEFSRPVRALVCLVLLALPVAYAAFRFDRETGFTALICFGRAFETRLLPEARAVPRRVESEIGYDGQFYAQVALAPALRRPDLARALDHPRYRAQRILVPALAYAAGRGHPWLVLNAYALANVFFFALLLAAWIVFVRPRTPGQILCMAAAAWSTGALVSVRRALLDLPAATLTFWAASWGGWRGAFALAAALLTRETCALSLPAVLAPRAGKAPALLRAAAQVLLILLPLALWIFYVRRRLPPGLSVASLNLGPPGVAWLGHLRAAAKAFALRPGITRLFEVLAPLSLAAQATYFGVRPRPSDRYWRMGAGFAVLFFFIGPPLFEEQIGYCRAVLPMTVAFNALLAQRAERPRRFAAWLIAGNVGLAWAALHMLAEMWGRF